MKIHIDVFPPFKELIVGLLIHQAVKILGCMNFARLENPWAPNFKIAILKISASLPSPRAT